MKSQMPAMLPGGATFLRQPPIRGAQAAGLFAFGRWPNAFARSATRARLA